MFKYYVTILKRQQENKNKNRTNIIIQYNSYKVYSYKIYSYKIILNWIYYYVYIFSWLLIEKSDKRTNLYLKIKLFILKNVKT